MKNKSYWKHRFEQLEAAANQEGIAYYQSIEPQFYQAQQTIENQIRAWYQRFVVNNQISMDDARKLLTSKELKEFKWDVQDYIKYGEENSVNEIWMKQLENASARYHISRLEALKLQTQQSMEVLFGNHLDGMDSLMKRIYSDGYYHTAFEIQKGFGIGWDVASIDQNRLKKIISKPWAADGKNFSDRIWQDKTKLNNGLHKELTQMCVLGKSPDTAIKNISKSMNTSKSNAGKLVMTESAFFASASQKDCFNELDVERFEIVATLDSHTSDICQDMDGETFDMKDYEPGVTAPPFHPWCRSTTVPAFDDEFDVGERTARGEDGKTYYVPANIKYPEWKKAFVDGQTDGLQEVNPNDIMKNKMHFSPASTIKEAEEFAKNILGVPNASYKGVDLTTANAWNEGLKDSFTRFPELKNNFGFVGEAHERNAALKPIVRQYYTDELIKLNPKYNVEQLEPYIDKEVRDYMKNLKVSSRTMAQSWSPRWKIVKDFRGVTVNRDFGKNSKDFIDSLKWNVQTNFHPKYCDTIRSVLDHEIGHQLDDLLGISEIPEVQNLFDARTYDELTNVISKYSWDNANSNKYSEMIAEAWAEYCNNPAPREIANTIGKIIEKTYKLKYGK